MGEYDWILRSERAKTRKPKGQYLYDELKDDDSGLINARSQAEHKWRKQNESPSKHDYNPDESQIDFQGPKPSEILDEKDSDN